MHVSPHTIEALQKVLDATKAAREQFRSAVGQRHFVVGLGGNTKGDGNDLYFQMLDLENVLITFEENVRAEIAKQNRGSCPAHPAMTDLGNGTFACGCEVGGEVGKNKAQREGRA